jgi:2-amino-4-hydroxy-6-hydroxymethyldihydropteridine diphosphokinase
VKLVKVSSFFSTAPVGPGRQPRYLNAVALAEPGLAPGALLRLAKRIERRAGRRFGPNSAARPLDIDILDYGGRRLRGADRPRARGRLILPHPELHARAFVLQPLLQVAPAWRHPVLGLSAKTLLARLTRATRAGVRQALDLACNPCDKVRC